MHDRTAHQPDHTERAAIDASRLAATADGTRRLARRHTVPFADDFYRDAFGLAVSSIGAGTYLGDSTDADDAAYQAAIEHAVASGVNFIDTAINYRCQRSELAVCAALQRLFADGIASRDELVVASKGGYIPLDRTPPASRDAYRDYVRTAFIEPEILRDEEIVAGGHSLAPRFLRYCLAKSRQNLGVRAIDVYFVHNPEQQLGSVDGEELHDRLGRAFAMLEEAASRREISVYGVATWDGLRTAPGSAGHLELERLVELARGVAGDAHRFRAIELPVSLAMPEAASQPTQTVGGKRMTVLEAADHLGLAVIGSATLLQGRLTAGLPESVGAHFPGLATDAQRAIAFARGLPGVTTSLVGMRGIAHVDENLGAVRRRDG